MERIDLEPIVDEAVLENIAYEYLCHLQEAKLWMESLLKETLPPAIELEENLRNGVYLAKIGNIIAPEEVPLSRIYDIFQHRYKTCGLQFKHTDNINYWIKALNAVKFPKLFHPIVMDVYNKKNMSNLIYSIHALSAYLFKLGKANSIQDLYGKIDFSKDEIEMTCNELRKLGAKIPFFKQISGIFMDQSDDKSAQQKFIIKVDNAIRSKNSEDLLNCLCDPVADINHVIPENIAEYMTCFQGVKEEKLRNAQNRSVRNNSMPDLHDEVLTQSEIQGYIRSKNYDCLWRDILTLVKLKNKGKLKEIIPQMSVLEIKDYKPNNIDYYIEALTKQNFEKMALFVKENSSREIMESFVRSGNRLYRERKRVLDALNEVKKAVKYKCTDNLGRALRVSTLKLVPIILEENIKQYMDTLRNRLKSSGDLTYHDIKSSIEDVNEATRSSDNVEVSNSVNLVMNYQISPSGKLSPLDVPENKNVSERTKIHLNNDLEKFIISFQAHIRGFLLRIEIKKKKELYYKNDLRESRVKRKGERKSEDFHSQLLKEYMMHIDQITKIQAFWRGYLVRKSLKIPSIRIRHSKFVLLRIIAQMRKIIAYDYSVHLEAESLKSSVFDMIKKNQELASKLDEVDTKIGLLVHNRIKQNLDFNGTRPDNGATCKLQPKGIKTFSREAKTLLDGYRQLFYMLQTDPAYLMRLIIHLPEKSTQIIQSWVLSLFNYGSSLRDTYFLLRLFRCAIVEEVKCKFQKPMDAIKGNSIILRLAIGFYRQYEGYSCLRKILGLLIENVLNEKTYIDTNPMDIYRRWINELETETGKASDLPLTVTQDKALSHPEVANRLRHNIQILKTWVKTFLERIFDCANEFPYVTRFIAKVLWKALRERFPEEPETDIMKIVGNLVFYQYINSAIVAPDTLYIISLPSNQHLKLEQRRNLASIAKILQFASWKKGFGKESQHLVGLNSFIISCHEQMKLFFKKCCSVEDLEEHFNMTKYSEAALIEKPKIYITLEEICECHKILFEQRQLISNDPLDPIQDVLDVLGDPPSLADLVGSSSEETLSRRVGKAQVCLELENKFLLPPEDPTEIGKLFIRTKELIINRISEFEGTTLKESLEKQEHSDIASNLMQLELSGMVKSSDDYSCIVDSILSDIMEEKRYKQNLTKEIRCLKLALDRLNEKKKYYEDQLSYYEQYLHTCLSSLTKAPNKSKFTKMRCAKYSANHLLHKGILVSVEGVPNNQLKNVQFEISVTDVSSVYSIKGRFMGIEVEAVNLDVQDLLQLQFEGQSVMEIFGRAKININLLLNLLNKKFHCHK